LSEGGATHPGMSDEALKGMLAAQATWDATMGWNAVEALKRANDASAVMVVLVGGGHVAYGLGIERQARHFFDGGIATVVPVPVTNSDGAPVTSVRASYANFIYAVQGERDAAYPTLGISTTPGQGGRAVIDVEKDTPGARAGLKVGDTITAFDDQPLVDKATFNRLMAGKLWGDVVELTIVRDGRQEKVPVPLTRMAASPAATKK